MRTVYYGWNKNSKIPRSLGIRILAVVCMFVTLANLFGCNKKTEYPFDMEKAYHYSRQGVIAGGGFQLKFNPEGVVEHYSYVKPAPEDEDGMKDRGSDIYFVGLKEGVVEVTAVYKYPTCLDEEYTFTLVVDKDLRVTKKD